MKGRRKKVAKLFITDLFCSSIWVGGESTS